jgi:enediyne biosynthesis protein E4
MNRTSRTIAVLVGLIFFAGDLPAQAPRPGAYPFAFTDAGDSTGLFPHAANIWGHGAGWGDVDGDGWIDLFVATFHEPGSKPGLFFRNKKGKFEPDAQKPLSVSARGTGVVFADLDNDGDLGLYLGNMPDPKSNRVGCTLLSNDGKGNFTNISKDCGACPPDFGGRSVAVLDYDGDGLLDLLVGEDPIPGYNGSKTKRSRLFRNKGNLKFEDVTDAVGFPAVAPGLGVAAADVNNDGRPDLFLCSGTFNALFLNDGKGKFTEMPGSRQLFAYKGAGEAGGDNMVCGVCFGDVNRDGRLDLVLGQHYSTPWRETVPNKLFINRGIIDGVPTFEDVTEKAGLTALGMKSPHVELQDFDNDGWPDIYFSTVKFAGGKPYPVIFRHQGEISAGVPRFRDDAWAVNDFPTAADRAIADSGKMFEKVKGEKKVVYTAPGPTGDYDNDGRLDLFLPNWWPDARSMLLRNETKGGNWLRVQVEGAGGANRMGIGSRANLYTEGKLGETAALLGCREIAAGYGYASGQPAYTHFGLGGAQKVDVEVILPHGKGKLTHRGATANQVLKVKQ